MLKTQVRMAPGATTRMVGTLSEQRLRGRAAVTRRDTYLRAHPLCTLCQADHLVEPATVPDHIVPLWAGGADDLDTNGQPLCEAHHSAKTACEAAMRAVGAWLATPCTCGQHLNSQKAQASAEAQGSATTTARLIAAPARA